MGSTVAAFKATDSIAEPVAMDLYNFASSETKDTPRLHCDKKTLQYIASWEPNKLLHCRWH